MGLLNNNSHILEVLSEAISEGVVIVDERQYIVSVNTALQEMFGYAKDELLQEHLHILIPQNYHQTHKKDVERFVDKGQKRQMGRGRNLHGRHKEGHLIPVEVGLNPFSVEGKTFVMAIVIDITIRKAQEEKILELNSQLEEKIADRTKRLKLTVEQLQEEVKKRQQAEKKIKRALKREKELNELKTKFLSMVSHEFKTPLSGILTSVMLLGKYTETEQQDKRDRHIRTITDKVHYLNTILNDFLSIEKLDTGKVTYKMTHFKLSKVINEVIYNANMLLKPGQRITFPNDIDAYDLYFDEKILELSLSNLIHNAIKYSPEDTNIALLLSLGKETLAISVKDQGIGIPDAAQKNIFSRYFRAENVLNEQGTGIGLNIVKGHLKNLDGTIDFESKQDEGSIFTITIPYHTTQKQAEE